MTKQKHILWLASKDTPHLYDKREQLKKHHFSCTLINSVEELRRSLKEQRVPVIIVSEGEDENQTRDFIMAPGMIPDARGSRWLYILSSHNPDLIFLAGSANFRDVIPFDLPDQQWLHRVLFSSAGSPLPFPIPMNRMTLDHPARLIFPARLVSISRDSLRVECPVTPEPKVRLSLGGSFLFSSDPGELQIEVQKSEHSSLTHRFSTAVTAGWSHQGESNEEILRQIRKKISLQKDPGYRVYMAVKSRQSRELLLSFFDRKKFDVNTALTLKNLISEPPFYTPDLIVIEEFLCLPPHKDRFKKMLELVSPQTGILVVGSEFQATDTLKSLCGERTYIEISEPDDQNISQAINRLMLSGKGELASESGVYYFDKRDPLSSVELILGQGRLSSVHPYVIEIGSPCLMKNFSLCQVDSPFLTRWLGKKPWLKLTELSDKSLSRDKKITYTGAGFLADVSQQDKHQLAKALILFMSRVFHTPMSKSSPEAMGAAARETPAFDSEDSLFTKNSLVSDTQIGQMDTTRYYDEHDIETPQSAPSEISGLASKPGADLSHPGVRIFSDQKPEHVDRERDLFKVISDALFAKEFLYVLVFLFVSFITFAAIQWWIPVLSKSYEKSGAVFVDQIEKYQGGSGRENSPKKKNQ